MLQVSAKWYNLLTMKRARRITQVGLPLLVTIVLVTVLLRQVEVAAFAETFTNVHTHWLFLAVAILWSAHFVVAYRWKVVLNLFDAGIRYRQVLLAYFANLPISKLLPLYSGDFVRAYYFKEEIGLRKNTGGVLAETIIDVLVLVAFVFLSGILAGNVWFILLSGLTLVIGVVFMHQAHKLAQLSLLHRIHDHLEHFFQAFLLLKTHKRATIFIVVCTTVMWVATLLFTWFAFHAFGADVPLGQVFLLQPLVIFIGLIPITLSGIGTRESAMVVLYASHAASPTILAVGFSYSVLGMILLPLLVSPITFVTWRRILMRRQSLELPFDANKLH